MRLWLRDSERRPDPRPVQTDDRIPIGVGTGAWIIALVVLVLNGPAVDGWSDQWLVTCIVGILLGPLGLLYSIRRRR